jgi:hypothetical protein
MRSGTVSAKWRGRFLSRAIFFLRDGKKISPMRKRQLCFADTLFGGRPV